MNNAPTLETERLRLDWLTLDDVPLMLAIWNDPAFMTHVGDRGIRTPEQAEQALRDSAFATYKDFAYGPFRVTRKEDGVAMGVCGLYKRDYLDDPDIGFALLPDYCGSGYGWESALAVRDHARDDLGLKRVTAIVSPANRPSIGLIEKLGFHHERNFVAPDDEHECSLYAVEW